MKRLNLTQHVSTPEQGCYEPRDKERVIRILTVDDLPSNDEIFSRVEELVQICVQEDADEVMIGGAPWMMPMLERHLAFADFKPIYSFSKRESIEETLPDGKVVKRSVFRHAGFIVPKYSKCAGF